MKQTLFTIALLAATATMTAQENATVDVHSRYTKVVAPVKGEYDSAHPSIYNMIQIYLSYHCNARDGTSSS